MRPRRIAAGAATLLAATTFAPTVANAVGQNTLYVNNANSACTDTGTGTEAAPFCTIQAAVNVANPGDAVTVVGGNYYGPLNITRSGTAAAPITISTLSGRAIIGYNNTTTADNVTLSGASDVVIKNFTVYPGSAGDVSVSGGSGVTLADVSLAARGTTAPDALHVTSGASGVTVMDSYLGAGLVVDGGSTGTIVTTNEFSSLVASPVTVSGASNTAITSNTIGNCGPGISVASSTGTSIENNVIAYAETTGCPASAQGYGVMVDAGSAASTKLDYNDVDARGGTAAYYWNGNPYTTAAALYSATSQGQHDYNGADANVIEGSPIINSADSGAIGEQATDYNGSPRVLDPTVTPTGTGPYDYYDRGAVQFQDPVSLNNSSTFTTPVTQAPAGGPIPVTAKATDTWGDTLTYTFTSSSDQTLATSSTGTADVSFPTAGSSTIYAFVKPSGSTSSVDTFVGDVSVNVVAAAPFTPQLALSPASGAEVTANASGTTDPYNLVGESFDFGDGSAPVQANPLGSPVTHDYTKAGTYTVKVTATDAGGNTATATGTYSTVAPGTEMHDVFNSNATPQGDFASPGGTGFAHSSITGMPDGSSQLVAVTTTGGLEHDIRLANGSWQGWRPLTQTGVTVTDAAIAGMPDGSSQVIEVLSNGTLMHNIRNANGTWQPQGWASPGGTGIAKIAMAVMPDGSTQFVAVTTAGVLEHNIRFANGSWQGWRPLTQTGVTVTDAAIAGMPDGSSQIVEIANNCTMEHDIRYANGSWQPQGWASPAPGCWTHASITAEGSSTFFTAVNPAGGLVENTRNSSGGWSAWQGPNSAALGPVGDSAATQMPNGTVQVVAVTAAGS